MNKKLKYYVQKMVGLFLDEPVFLKGKVTGYSLVKSERSNVLIAEHTNIVVPFYLKNVVLGQYSYIGKNSNITNTEIGKFCSIGPNFCCGLGIHPVNGISTSPMFYSTARQNGVSLVSKNKMEESKRTIIGNDVFVGANVTVLDGITIGDGAVVGAGAVVTKNIPPYAIAVGVPAKVVKYRFKKEQIEELAKVEWWNFDEEKLKDVEKYFFDINGFLKG
jgi:acetyltransferase-like isoleucine patch superfamily enzyme